MQMNTTCRCYMSVLVTFSLITCEGGQGLLVVRLAGTTVSGNSCCQSHVTVNVKVFVHLTPPARYLFFMFLQPQDCYIELGEDPPNEGVRASDINPNRLMP